MLDKKKLTFIFFVLDILLIFSACTTGPSSGISIDPSSGRGTFTQDFIRGDARLECYLPCAGKYGANRHDLKMLHDAGIWKDLALKVLEIGNYGDQQYYYLGRAAEGLGYISAAEIYYKLSVGITKSGRYTCGGLINVCDDFHFPQAAESRLGIIAQAKKQAEIVGQEKLRDTGVPSNRNEAAADSQGLAKSTSRAPEATSQSSDTRTTAEMAENEAAARVEQERREKEARANVERAKQEQEAKTKVEQRRQEDEARRSPKPTGVTVKDSEFDPTATFIGITQQYPGGVFFLRSWVNKKTGNTTHQVYIGDVYTSSHWKYWLLASDDQALTLNVVGIKRDVSSCSRYSGCIYEEHIGIDVPDVVLRRRSTGEYRIKIQAKSGDEKIISLGEEVISSQLEEIERYKIANKLIKPPAKSPNEKLGSGATKA